MKFLAAATLAIASITAQAGTLTVGDLHYQLNGTEFEKGLASGFIIGIWDSNLNKRFCPTPDMEGLDLQGLIRGVTFAIRNADPSESAERAMVRTLSAAIPCKQTTKTKGPAL